MPVWKKALIAVICMIVIAAGIMFAVHARKEANKKKAYEAFANSVNLEQIRDDLQSDLNAIVSEGEELREKSQEILNNVDEALKRGDEEEVSRLLEEYGKLISDEK